MARRLCLLLTAALGACVAPSFEAEVRLQFKKLVSEDPAERAAAFQQLTRTGTPAIPLLKAALEGMAPQGFPLVALLYVQGEGDAVPLELRARHLAAFRWPREHTEDNAIVEPFVWHEIERDLVRAGRPALRLLSESLRRETPTEEKALQVVRVMLSIGGRGAAEEFARLLDADRDLGETRVNEAAAAALLYLGRQELALRSPRGARVEAARAWWTRAQGQAEEIWIREAAGALAERWRPGDLEGVRPVFELFVGESVEDPREWWGKHPDWRPTRDPAPLKDLLEGLAADRPRAFEANRRLEALTGTRLDIPRAVNVGELCAALRLWGPPADLAVRWRRYAESPFLKLSIAIVGWHPGRGENHLIWWQDRVFHATEDETGGTGGGEYMIYAQSRQLGTRLVLSEYAQKGRDVRGFVTEASGLEPAILFSPTLGACAIVWVDEVAGKRSPRPAEAVFAELRGRLRKRVEGTVGEDRLRALRALSYFQNPEDGDLFRKHGATGALLMLGDPAGLEGKPALEPHEAEMALRKARDPAVRKYLEGLRN